MIIWTSLMSKIDFFFSLLTGLTSSLWRWNTAAPAVCARSPPPSSQCTDVPWDTTGSCRIRKHKRIQISSTWRSSQKTLKGRFFFRFYLHDHTPGAIIALSNLPCQILGFLFAGSLSLHEDSHGVATADVFACGLDDGLTSLVKCTIDAVVGPGVGFLDQRLQLWTEKILKSERKTLHYILGHVGIWLGAGQTELCSCR